MAFVIYETGKPKISLVRRYFSRNKWGNYITITFTKKLVNELNWKVKDRLEFRYNDENPWHWVLEKKSGGKYSLGCPSATVQFLQIKIKWNLFNPTEEEWKTLPVKHKIIGNALHVFGNEPMDEKGE